MEEPFAQVVVERQHFGRQRQEDPGMVTLRPHLAFVHDLNLDPRPVASLPDAPVDGIGNKFTQGQSNFIPVLSSVVQDKAQVIGLRAAGTGDGIDTAVLDDNPSEILARVLIGHGLGSSGEHKPQGAAKDDRIEFMAKADCDCVFVA